MSEKMTTERAVLSCIGSIVLLAASTAARAYISAAYWEWFAVPFGAPSLPWQVPFAAATWVGYSTFQHRKAEDLPDAPNLWFGTIIMHGFAWVFGFALHLSLRGAA